MSQERWYEYGKNTKAHGVNRTAIFSAEVLEHVLKDLGQS